MTPRRLLPPQEAAYWSCLAASKRHRRSGPREQVIPAVRWDSIATAELAAFGLLNLSADEASVSSQLRTLAARMRADGLKLGRSA